jgi:prenyltransferase beta subunit
LPVPAALAEPSADRASAAFVAALQNTDGGFRVGPMSGDSSLRATSAALRAMKYFGGKPRDRDQCVRFVETCHDGKSGGFADRPGGQPDVFTTAVGLMALKELGLPLAPYANGAGKFLAEHAKTFDEIRIAAAGWETLGQLPPETTRERWLRVIGDHQAAVVAKSSADGAAREAGRVVVTIWRITGEPADPDQRAEVLRKLELKQRADGGFGKSGANQSDLESCYQVVRAFHMAKAQPADVAKLRAFIARCRNADGGYGVEPTAPSTVPATYYASILRHWLGMP